MKYVGLLSGGKDSCFNLLHCHQNGHELVATASFGPQHGKEEIDSYLYQTVGQDAIEVVARALDVPLYRRIISGTAVEQGSEYGGRIAKDSGAVQGDETEDLYELLSIVKQHHPDVEGVSVGAILSNYQRVRVEHVCRRLGLTALSYLWQRDQSELLSEMIDAGMEVILIKVAGIGLTPNHLGKTLAEMQPTLLKLNAMYGSHVCGEGGEYESLTLDCPLFGERIKLLETEAVTHSDNDFATVAYLRIKNAELEPKTPRESNVAAPPLLEEDFIKVEAAILAPHSDPAGFESPMITDDTERKLSGGLYKSSSLEGPWITIADIHNTIPNVTFEEEVENCFRLLQDRLADYNLGLSNCVNINVFLSSIDLFAPLNSVYAKFFGTSPPARASVAIDLRPPTRIKIDCIAYKETSPLDRKALHVQGLSYWAPANIGPYSQAIQIGEHVFISGQIGLIPSSLSLPSPPSLATETALAFQHVRRVTNAMNNNSSTWEGSTQLALYWLLDTAAVPRVLNACAAYSQEDTTPTLLIGISALPKGALIEKQVLLHTGQYWTQEDDDDEMVLKSQKPDFQYDRIQGDDNVLYYEVSSFKGSGDTCAIICSQNCSSPAKLEDIAAIQRLVSCAYSVRLFHLPTQEYAAFEFCNSLFYENHYPPVTSLPSSFIYTKTSESWSFAICILAK